MAFCRKEKQTQPFPQKKILFWIDSMKSKWKVFSPSKRNIFIYKNRWEMSLTWQDKCPFTKITDTQKHRHTHLFMHASAHPSRSGFHHRHMHIYTPQTQQHIHNFRHIYIQPIRTTMTCIRQRQITQTRLGHNTQTWYAHKNDMHTWHMTKHITHDMHTWCHMIHSHHFTRWCLRIINKQWLFIQCVLCDTSALRRHHLQILSNILRNKEKKRKDKYS